MSRRLALAALLVVPAGCGSSTVVQTTQRRAETMEPLDITREPANPTTGLPDNLATIPPRATKQRAGRGAAKPRQLRATGSEAVGAGITVTSTAYCLTGVTANGEHPYPGSVGMNGVPFGSVWRIVGTGREYRVNDRIGHGSGFDIAMPGDCAAALNYGRRTITVERVA